MRLKMKKIIDSKNPSLFIISVSLVLTVVFLTFGWSAFNEKLLINNVVVGVKQGANIQVTGLSVSDSGTKMADSDWQEYYDDSIESDISLTNPESQIEYKVEITNFGDTDMGILDITGSVLPENGNNLDGESDKVCNESDAANDSSCKLVYNVKGYELESKICDKDNKECNSGIKKNIYINLRYNNNNQYTENNTDYVFNLDFDFKPFHRVSYEGFGSASSGYPKEVIDGGKLIVDLGQTADSSQGYEIYIGDNKINDNEYTIDNGKLEIENVTNNVKIIRSCKKDTLYDAVVCGAYEGLAEKYVGNHKDNYSTNPTADIYYWHAGKNDTANANKILNKWNVVIGSTCWQMIRTTDTGGVKLIYNGTTSDNKCTNLGTTKQILSGSKEFNSASNSLAYVGYMYNTIYNVDSMSSSKTHVYGNSVTYNNGIYTLSSTVNGVDDHHHYTCGDTTTTCESIKYIYYVNNDTEYYITLTGGDTIDTALSKMLSANDVNSKPSKIKETIDKWYSQYLINYAGYLDADTVFCNNRKISNKGGWDPEGNVSSLLEFSANNLTTDLSCENETDKFSINNSSARLTYPIGLATTPEVNLLGNIYLVVAGEPYWLLSPYNFDDKNANVSSVNTSAMANARVVTSVGARPVIAVSPNYVKINGGDGSMENPYKIG